MYATTGQGVLGNNMFAYCNNNPLRFSDSEGNWPKLSEIFTAVAATAIAVAAVAAVVAVCTLAAPAAIAIGGTVVTTSAVVSVGTQAVAVAGCSAVAALASQKIEESSTQTYSVYFLEDSNGAIQYVGRVTDSGYNDRMRYHAATRGLTPQLRVSGLSYAEARGLEEIGMIECHTLNASNTANNQIHGISPRNKNGEKYMVAACNYLYNRAEDALLNLIS